MDETRYEPLSPIIGFMKYSQDNLMVYLWFVFIFLALLYIFFRYRPGHNVFYYILVLPCYLMLEKYIWMFSLILDETNGVSKPIFEGANFKMALLMFLAVDVLFFNLFVPMIFQTHKKITIQYDEFAQKLLILHLFRHFVFKYCEWMAYFLYLSFPLLDLPILQLMFYISIYLIYKHLKKNRVF